MGKLGQSHLQRQGLLLLLRLLPGFTATSLPNIAPSGTASQSSTINLGNAYHANDGNTDPNYSDGSCSHTESEEINWWSLLLPAVYRITSVTVTNRNILEYRINGAVILIGNSLDNNGNNNPSCAVITSIPAGLTRTFYCGGMIGRLVNIFLNSAHTLNPLTLCEVKVYGELAAPAPSFSAVVMGRNIAVVETELCWSDALFYCRDFYWDLLSIRTEEEQLDMEEVLRTASLPLTKNVWLGLRRDLMEDQWFWMSGDSMNYTSWETNTTWQLTSPCGGIDTSSSFYWRDVPCEAQLYFICLTDIQTDVEKVDFFSTTRP